MKSRRQEKILELIQDHDVETQEQLLEELTQEGFKTTQATISRDIKQLHIVKEMNTNGNYHYHVITHPTEHVFSEKLQVIFHQCITNVDVAQNIIVIKTMPGLASAACSALDGMRLPEIVGTLGGDDTALVIMRDNATANDFCLELSKQISGSRE